MSSREESCFETYSKIVKDNGIYDEIKDVIVKAAELVGDQFGSQCELVTVVFKDKIIPPLEMFVKKTASNPQYASQLRELMMFEKEVLFFNLLLPDLKAFAEKNAGYDGFLDRIFPKCYFASDCLVVLENLTLKGYSILDIKVPHDFETARLVIQNLAQIHGAVLAYIAHIGSEEFEKKYDFITARCTWAEEGRTVIGPWVELPINGVIRILKEKPTPGSEEALKHYLKYENTGFDACIKLFRRDNQKCANVVNHGDLWNGNVMFQSNPETQKPENPLIIDMQTINLGTPALDLQHYLFLALNLHVLHSNWKKLLTIYYKDLTKIVETLGENVNFTFDDLESDFKSKCLAGSFLGLYTAYGVEALDGVGDLANSEGDALDKFALQMNTSLNKLLGSRGEEFSKKVVKVYQIYQDVQAGIETQE